MVAASREADQCENPVRSCEELYFQVPMANRDTSKSLIKLSIGDPSVFGNLPPHEVVYEAVRTALDSHSYNGYGHSTGLEITRRAVAEAYSIPEAPLTAQDVVMANACSGAIEMALSVLANPGQNVLVPTPCFGLYQCHAECRDVQLKFYKLLPERGWECDLADMEQQIDDQTAAIIVVNPSNPCGSVFSRQHITDIVAVAEKHRRPILADEIYDGMVFEGVEFTSVAAVSRNVPVLSTGGMSKKYMVPGWRLGWILIHDRNGAFEKVKVGLSRLAMKVLGPNTVIQAALPEIFARVPESYHKRNMALFESNARRCHEALRDVRGITPIMPAGAMYLMVVIEMERFPTIADDVAFTSRLLMEESVFCLPGRACLASGCFRIVLIMPDEQLVEACGRIRAFCERHYQA